MSFLGSNRPHNAAADDIEAHAADRQNVPHLPTAGRVCTNGSGSGEEHIRFGEHARPKPKSSDFGEFEALDRYITSYDQERRASLFSVTKERKKRKWWQFWKSGGVETVVADPTAASLHVGKPPPTWLETDIHTGISSSEIEERRKRFGWNELVAEKEDMLAKIFGYFTGPILYGK
jgi:H+-transporting ATPase